MALRSFVTGSDACAPSDRQGGRNAVGALAETLLQRTRANEQTRQGGASSSGVQNFFDSALTSEEREKISRGVVPEDLTYEEWEKRPAVHESHPAIQGELPSAALDRQLLFSETLMPAVQPELYLEERDRALSEAFKHFLSCARSNHPFNAFVFPDHLKFDPVEQQKTTVHKQQKYRFSQLPLQPLNATRSVLKAQHFLESLHIAPVTSAAGTLNRMWNGGRPPQDVQLGSSLPFDWTEQFSKLYMDYAMPRQESRPVEAQEQSAPLSEHEKQDAKDVSSALIQQMANDPDPKFRNSKFLQFVQKLNSGELVIENNQVKEAIPREQWGTEAAPEYAQMDQRSPEAAQRLETDRQAQNYGVLEGGWLDEDDLQEWLENYQQMAYGPTGENQEYGFSPQNPYLQDPAAFSAATSLFANGNLNEAALAAEAEVQRAKENVEAWILLGKIHAENDNDPQAIAALNRARELDASHLTVLLDLAVCHSNELHEHATVDVLMAWLQNHPQHQSLPELNSRPPDPSQALSHTIHLFHQAVASSPGDVDAVVALGVLHHLGRDFEEAISLFTSSIALRPDDHSLWNKLGAAQANAARSGDAITAYQKALERKPTYMRAWANLGISYANVGDYETSVRHYVRALSLNQKADTVWAYLKSSAICSGLMDVLGAVDSRDVAFLKKRFSV